MPRGDRSGPDGKGPGTGRAAGACAGRPFAGCENPLPSGGAFGRGGGRGGRGCRNRYDATGLTGRQQTDSGWYPAQSSGYPHQVPYTQMTPRGEAETLGGPSWASKRIQNRQVPCEHLGDREANKLPRVNKNNLQEEK
jgi:hypothetical protein